MNHLIYRFLLKGLIFFFAWYIIYELIILPDGRLDTWLSINIIEVSSGLANLIGFESVSAGRIGGIDGGAGIEVVNGCNGISAMGLFLGFMVAWPSPMREKWAFILVSLLVLYLVNVVRIITLMMTQIYWPSFFDFTYDYSTTTIFYIIIFALWILWTEKGSDWSKLNPSNATT